MMKNLCLFANVIFGIFAVAPFFATARDLQSQPPVIKLYEVDGSNNVIRPWDRIDNQLSEAIIEKLDHLRLECTAYYPVQWIYTGNGIPLLSSNISLSTSQKRSEGLSQYTASAFISPLKEHHTGRYQCSHTEYLTLSPYLYIYVPGQALFTSLQGKTIQIPRNDSTILIPCSVSHPSVQVSLEKSDGEVLKKPVTKSNDAIVYDPREGFRVNLNKIEDPEGTYACTARYNHLVRGVEYTVTSQLPRPSQSQNEEEFQQSPPDTCNGESCEKRCETHTDCSSTMSCYTDRVCRDPCIHSIRCGKGASCRVVKQRPECYCPRDFVGDATKECFNTLQGSPSDTTPGVLQPTISKSCKLDEDCPNEQQCYKSSFTSSVCIDPCKRKTCGQNAKCVNEKRSANCYCLSGFVGDANTQCGPIKLEVETIPAPVTSVNRNQQPSNLKTSCVKSEDCGLYTECKENQCKCKAGFIGTPPKCYEDEMDSSEMECTSHRDCANNQVCSKLSASRNHSTCADVCGSRICGVSAMCYEEKNTTPFCLCPAGFIGNPYEKCQDVSSKLGRDCEKDSQCGKHLRCETGATYRKCTDPCARRTCPNNQECRVENHRATCFCSAGHTGNPQIGCNKDLVITKEKLVDGSAESGCRALQCGQNSECRMTDGFPTCFCQSGYIGLPPFCRQECSTNVNCPQEQVCIQKRCRSGCTNKCGKNAKCRLSPGSERTPICSCPEGFEGNPNIECTKS